MVQEAAGAEPWDWPRRDKDQRPNLPRMQTIPTLTDREVALDPRMPSGQTMGRVQPKQWAETGK